MSSRIRNTFNAGACALMIGAAAVTLAPISSSAQLRLDREGGFGNKGGGFGNRGGFERGGRGDSDLGKADRGTHRQDREGKEADKKDTDRGPYGTARAYLDVGLSVGDVGVLGDTLLSPNRAFLQWAGMTGGITESFYDFYSVPAAAYGGYVDTGDSGDPGWLVFGYTTELGNGLVATITAEQRQVTQIIDLPSNTWDWVVGGGLRLNFPGIAEGDYFQGAAVTSGTQANLLDSMLPFVGVVDQWAPIAPPSLTFNDVALGSDILLAPIGSLPPLTFNFAAAAGISAGSSDWAGADRLSKDFLP